MRLLLLSTSLLFLASCQTVEIPDFRPDVVLPASGDCYGITVVTGKKRRIAKDDPECIKLKRTSILLAPDQYAIIKKSYYKMCITMDCKQAVKVMDDLFLTIDKAAQAVYGGD